jgi:site-specific DNA-methyltransferase (adenine-specific)
MKDIEELKNKVICGDCLEVMKDIPDKSIDLTVTSPPYDNLRDYNGYTFDFEGIANELYRVTKDGGVVVWVVGDATIKGSETGTSFKQALYFKEIGFNLHDTMIYDKGYAPNPSNVRYNQSFEFMFIFVKGKILKFNPIKEGRTTVGNRISTIRLKDGTTKKEERLLNSDRTKRNIWHIDNGFMRSSKDKISFKHPATFPEKLAEDHILSWSNEGDTILDPMAGSGTTLKMAKKNNRNYIGIEIAPEYIDIINKRLNEPIQTKIKEFIR